MNILAFIHTNKGNMFTPQAMGNLALRIKKYLLEIDNSQVTLLCQN
jgi:hypothetical protein